ncbi:MAG: hypothetical protein SFU25_02800 [Candidatus Caenarcaniphilales bacterium]|nr:hypothetical protein [Candidatus Caenarcaniphilales bacterium]
MNNKKLAFSFSISFLICVLAFNGGFAEGIIKTNAVREQPLEAVIEEEIQKINLNLKISGDMSQEERKVISNELKTFLSTKLKKSKTSKDSSLKVTLETQDKLAKLKMSYEADREGFKQLENFSSLTWSVSSAFSYTNQEEIIKHIENSLEDLFKSLENSANEIPDTDLESIKNNL